MSDLALEITAVDKFYGPIDTGVHAVKSFDMNVARGDIVALLGSSGCGKTSTLRMVAGFEEVSRGSIKIADREVNRLPPVQRNVAMAFEGYSLYPTVNVRDNIAFALKAKRLPQAQVDARVNEVAEMLEIADILDRIPAQVSGGQQQRASLARALIRDADLYLLDEPMGQLEPQLRTLLRGRIKHFIKERGLTAVLVTHDQTEANALADKIAVMEDGEMQQFASPAEIKERPANLFTGTFIGEPPMNVFQAKVGRADGRIGFHLAGDLALIYPAEVFSAELHKAILGKSEVALGVRPYAVRRVEGGAPAQVVTNQWLGDQSHIAARFAEGTLVLVEHDRARVGVGDQIGVELNPRDLHIFDPDTGDAISHGQELA
ncbi:putative erythritol ABC transporter 1, ATP-binding component 2 [Candidatus Rhodobacter oscarellae]|uniref:Putative erythritol ABC transporter 1, ATP-binding component 2 n=1 Tax=Candidatus Rhodobacter oscarellae TaxID=1675527 RepID=A0A0J9E0B0_9RHOB|nr:ABC transporter ATP-binding protein [Candidatus Rhodobacter lobularis]KMW56155.1 putative erythritol ABC transporter 1, ATP-binding component 2 [Candidatus Rhodobacter lobularis]